MAIVTKILHNFTQFLLTELRFLSIFTYLNNKTRGNNYENN